MKRSYPVNTENIYDDISENKFTYEIDDKKERKFVDFKIVPFDGVGGPKTIDDDNEQMKVKVL